MSAQSWEEELAGSLGGLAILLGILAASAVIGTLVILATELGRVFKERAFQDSGTARVLWGALAALLVAWLVSALLASNPATLVVGLYLATWSFLAFVVVVEGCDWYQARFDQPQQPAELSVSDVLSPWHLGEPEATPTGAADPVSPTLGRS